MDYGLRFGVNFGLLYVPDCSYCMLPWTNGGRETLITIAQECKTIRETGPAYRDVASLGTHRSE